MYSLPLNSLPVSCPFPLPLPTEKELRAFRGSGDTGSNPDQQN